MFSTSHLHYQQQKHVMVLKSTCGYKTGTSSVHVYRQNDEPFSFILHSNQTCIQSRTTYEGDLNLIGKYQFQCPHRPENLRLRQKNQM